MNKIIPAFFSVLGISMLIGCKGKNTYVTAGNGKSLVWEVTGRGLSKPSYFFGTMHLMCAEDAELTETVRSLIKNTDQIYLEVDLDNASELLTGILDLRSKSGHTLDDALSPEDYQKVKSFFEKLQPSVPFSLLEVQPPLMISSSLYELLLPCEQKNGVEMKIIDEAYKEKNKQKD